MSEDCAPCRFQGRRCNPNCRLAPYFPVSRFNDYVSAHFLYGKANMQKFLDSVEPSRRQTTAQSMLAEGHAWEVDPVCGPVGIIKRLLQEIDTCRKELDVVNRHLEFYRRRGEGDPNPSSGEQPPLTMSQTSAVKGEGVEPFDAGHEVPSHAEARTSKMEESSSAVGASAAEPQECK